MASAGPDFVLLGIVAWQAVDGECGGLEAMTSVGPIDDYLSSLDQGDRACLATLREQIRLVMPDVEECISYRVPAFRIEGSVVGGFAAFSRHLSYLPFSGSVLATLAEELGDRPRTKSALHFTASDPLPASLVWRPLEVRMAEIRERGR